MRTILLLALIITASAAFGADAKASFEAHDFPAAAKALQEQLATRPPSAEGYYNLGVAFEKAGEPVKAILNYERALLLDPGLRPAHNALAELAASRNIPLPPHSWTDDLNAVAHPDVMVMLGTILIWAGAFGLLFATQAKRRRSAMNALAVLALLSGGALAAAGWLADARMSTARAALVISDEGAEVLTAPANNSTPIISLPAGTPMQVLSVRGPWTFIDLHGGARGWVQTDRLMPIVPGEKL